MKYLYLILMMACTHLASAAPASLLGETEPEFLPVHEAFAHDITLDGSVIRIHWDIADGYYLYRKRFAFNLSPQDQARLGKPEFSRTGKIKQDETFGEVEVFYHNIDIAIPVVSGSGDLHLTTQFQGCAEAGLCYPPTKINSTFTLTQAVSGQPVDPVDSQDVNSIASYLSSAGLLSAVAVFFLLGLGLTFTPCVLPMVPILSSIIAGQNLPLSARKGFALSASYVLGMALTFAIAGMVVGKSGARIQIYFQDPVVLTVFALIFVILALSMFGFYELQLPAFLRDKLNNLNQKQQGGTYTGVFIMGALSALVVSPCVSAPLAGILLYIANEGDAALGAISLFALGLGMGAPLLVIGATGANVLPRAGGWMNTVKAFFGVMLLAVSAWLMRSVLPGLWMMLVWAALLIIPAIYMGAFEPTTGGWRSFWKGTGLMMFTYGTLLIIGAATGQTNPLKPIHFSAATSQTENTVSETGLPFKTVYTPQELNTALASARSAQKPVMIDYYADWCIACVEMEHGAFQDAEVLQTLTDFSLIQINLTNNDHTDQLLDAFDLIGPPSILFFNAQGEHLKSVDVMGEMSAQRFLRHLQEKVMPLL